jgi:HEAT repeat protein
MKRRAQSIAALGGLLALAAGNVRADAPTRADVEASLRKASDVNLPRLAMEAEVILIAIADDKAVEGPVRGRAVAALAYARSARTHTYLENLVLRKAPSSDPVDRLLVRRGAVALGWQSGPRVVDIIAPLLDHVDPDVRLDAAVALGLSRAAAAEAPLRARLSQENDPAVRRQIESALRAVAPQAAAK